MAKGTRAEDIERTKDANSKLKGEVRRLRKQVATLRKELNKFKELEEIRLDDSEDSWEMAELKKEDVVKLSKNCPKCNEVINIVKIGIYEFRNCIHCKWKKRLKLP